MEGTSTNRTVLRTETEPCRVRLDIEVHPDEVTRVLDATLATFRRSARIPGFRVGKAPKDFVMRRYRDPILEEAKRVLTRENLQAACDEQEVAPETTPRIENEEQISIIEGAPFVFSVTFDVAPTFDLPEYKGISVSREAIAIDDDSVQEVIGRWMRQRVSYDKVERASEPGDLLKVTYHGTLADAGEPPQETARFLLDAEETWIALQEPEIIPGSIEALTGSEAGMTKQLQVTYPDDYAEASLRGRSVQYNFSVLEVHAAQVPELDDDLAKEIGAADAEAVKDTVRKNLQAEQQREQERSVRNQVVETLLAEIDFPVPPGMLARETYQTVGRLFEEGMRTGKSADDLKKEQDELLARAKTLATRQLRRYYVLRRIGELENISVSEQELDAALDALGRYQRISGKTMQRRLAQSGRLADVIVGIRESKTIERIVDLADVTEVTPTPNGATASQKQE